MVTKNFLFLLVFSGFIFSGCDSMQRSPRHGNPDARARSAQNPQASPIPQGQTTGQANENVSPPSKPVTPVGVFLGPGAMRSFAHIGVLRALQKAQVPIVAIGGSEWGSVIAASFALSGKANEVEWEMMKLKKEVLPETSLLHRELVPKDSQSLIAFFKIALGDKDLGRSLIPFRCPYTDGDQTFFISKGQAKDLLSKCVILPPLFSPVEGRSKVLMSGAVNPGDWSGELRRAGAQYIIYVDVISQGALIQNGTKYESSGTLKSLWTAVKNISRAQHSFANLTIEVPMDTDLSDFEHRGETIARGEDAAKNTINQTLKAIGAIQ